MTPAAVTATRPQLRDSCGRVAAGRRASVTARPLDSPMPAIGG